MASIAVVGATGNTGRSVVKELRLLGEEPLCIVRNLEKAREVLVPDAKTVVADVTDRAALAKALKGIKRVFVVTGHNPQAGEQQINILEAAKAAGAELIVKVSGGRAVVGPNAESVVGRGHHMVEEAMKKSGLAWAILRPGLFMQNTLAQAPLVKNENKIVLPFAADLPLAFIDVRDTGAVGARILLNPESHIGKTYEFTGAVTNFREFTGVFSDVLGRTIAYIAATFEQAEQAMKARGLPDWLVAHQLVIARLAARGVFSEENTELIRQLAGRQPLTTRQYVEDYRAAFG
jgi:uncharacterized protein YbjT (DUF2867 family)